MEPATITELTLRLQSWSCTVVITMIRNNLQLAMNSQKTSADVNPFPPQWSVTVECYIGTFAETLGQFSSQFNLIGLTC